MGDPLDVVERLQSDASLVSLVGLGGIGKTSLAPADDLGVALRTLSASREVVLILDDLETIADAGALVRTLLDGDASLRLLATADGPCACVTSTRLVSVPTSAPWSRRRPRRSASWRPVSRSPSRLAAPQLRALTPQQVLDRL